MAALFRRRQSPRAPEAPAQGQDRTRRRTIRQSRLPVRTLLIAGGLLTGLTLLLLRAGPQQPAARQEGQLVFVSAAPIPARVPVVPEAVRMTRLPQERVPQDAVTDPREFAGRLTKAPIPPGEVIRKSMLGPPEEVLGISGALSPGLQAVSLVVQHFDALMGRVLPGDRVDVFATFPQPSPATLLLARGALVLSVDPVEVAGQQQGRQAGQRQADPRLPGQAQPQQQRQQVAVVLTVAVPPEEVAQVALGAHAGRVIVAMHPRRGQDQLAMEGVRGASMLSLVQEVLPKPSPPPGLLPKPPAPPPAPVLAAKPPSQQPRPAPVPALIVPSPQPAPQKDAEDRLVAVEVWRGAQGATERVPRDSLQATPREDRRRQVTRGQPVPLVPVPVEVR